MTTFKEVWRLKVNHDFFRGGICRGLKPCLSLKAESLLQNRGGKLIQKGISEWLLIAFDDNIFDDADQLELDFMCEDEKLVYSTEWDWTAGVCRQIQVGVSNDLQIDMETLPGERVVCKPNIFLRMVVSLHGANYQRTTVTELNFTSKSFFWEYWLVPRDRNTDRNLELVIKDSDKEIESYRYEDSNNPMNMPLMKFRTPVRIKSKEEGSERVSLYEILPSGIRRPLSRSLALPILGQFPLNKEDKDSVQVLVYI